MLTESELHEIVEPTLFLILSGLPNLTTTLQFTPQHMQIMINTLKEYRRNLSVNIGDDNDLKTALEQRIQHYIAKIEMSPSIGNAYLLNRFYFHNHLQPITALKAIESCVISHHLVSANREAIELVTSKLSQ